eukprot:348575-Amphidinium_carterae.1
MSKSTRSSNGTQVILTARSIGMTFERFCCATRGAQTCPKNARGGEGPRRKRGEGPRRKQQHVSKE